MSVAYANVIHGGDVDSLHYAMFEDHPQNQFYLVNQLNNFSHSLNEVGRKFMEETKTIYERLNNSEAIRAAKNAARKISGILHPNTIMYMGDINMLRNAQPIMQRYIMAQPDVRNLYHRQLCDGYSDTYVDYQPNIVGRDHYDYQRVVNDVIREFETEEGISWKIESFTDDDHFLEGELSFSQKSDILSTWDIIEMFLGRKEDITNIWGGDIGG